MTKKELLSLPRMPENKIYGVYSQIYTFNYGKINGYNAMYVVGKDYFNDREEIAILYDFYSFNFDYYKPLNNKVYSSLDGIRSDSVGNNIIRYFSNDCFFVIRKYDSMIYIFDKKDIHNVLLYNKRLDLV